ncbi:recombinase family protein [Oscillibacter sp.]
MIDLEAAAVVRRIYQMALDGYGLAETAAALENPACFPAI